MPEDIIDLGMKYASHRALRAWMPGDGLTCSFASRASRNRPCGPPVAVRLSTCHPDSKNPHKRKEVVCAYHISNEISPGELSIEAEVAAREKVLVAHWEEYQDAIREFMQPKIEEMIGDLPNELKLLVLDALARYDHTAETNEGT